MLTFLVGWTLVALGEILVRELPDDWCKFRGVHCELSFEERQSLSFGLLLTRQPLLGGWSGFGCESVALGQWTGMFWTVRKIGSMRNIESYGREDDPEGEAVIELLLKRDT